MHLFAITAAGRQAEPGSAPASGCRRHYVYLMLLVAAAPVGATVTLPASSGIPVNLDATWPGEAVFMVPPGTTIDNTGPVITGGATQNWQLTNYGTLLVTTGTPPSSALKLGSLDPGSARVDNFGVIQSNASSANGPSGVQFTNGGVVYNHAGGIISGPDGVHTDVASMDVYNEGQITGTLSSAVYTGQGARVQNRATGVLNGTYGVVSNGAFNVTLLNAGLISTSSYAIWFFGSGLYSIINTSTGVIEGGSTSKPAVLLKSAAQSQTLNYGVIRNPQGTAISASANGNVIVNAGSIIAGMDAGVALALTGDDNTIYNVGTLTGGTTAIQLSGDNNLIALGKDVNLPKLGILWSAPARS